MNKILETNKKLKKRIKEDKILLAKNQKEMENYYLQSLKKIKIFNKYLKEYLEICKIIKKIDFTNDMIAIQRTVSDIGFLNGKLSTEPEIKKIQKEFQVKKLGFKWLTFYIDLENGDYLSFDLNKGEKNNET